MQKHNLKPKISKDVSFHTFSNDSYLIHQSKYNHRVKVTEDTYNILNLLNGNISLKDISHKINKELNIDDLFKLLYINFGAYGIVESEYTTIKKSKKPSYLKLSFIVFPEKLISKITTYLKFLFSPKVMYPLIFACALLILITGFYNFNIASISEIKQQDWITLLILGFISVTFHELGHASATSFFGAKHGGIGGGFYLFSPVYFADVSDIWKLKPKQRIVVNLAGIYFELIISSIYILISFIFSQNILLIIGLLIFIKSLFNLNPFLRSDGYWIMSDALNIPNLHKVSRLNLRQLFFSLLKKEKNIISIKMVLLSIYAIFNFVILSLFLGYFIITNPKSVLYFTSNFYFFLKDIIQGTTAFSFANFQQFIMPLLFYYLVFRLIKGLIIKKKNNNHYQG